MDKSEAEKIIRKWWNKQIYSLPDMADVTDDFVIELIEGYWGKLKESADYSETISEIVLDCTNQVRRKSGRSNEFQQVQCTAFILGLLIMCMRLTEEKELVRASNAMQTDLDSKGISTDTAFNSLLDYYDSKEIAGLQKYIRGYWLGEEEKPIKVQLIDIKECLLPLIKRYSNYVTWISMYRALHDKNILSCDTNAEFAIEMEKTFGIKLAKAHNVESALSYKFVDLPGGKKGPGGHYLSFSFKDWQERPNLGCFHPQICSLTKAIMDAIDDYIEDHFSKKG